MSAFTDFNLSEPVLRAIKDLGFETPSAIQEQTLPLLLGDRTDFMGLAATGTGKTAAFSIPMLEKMEASSQTVKALILCPTRELALQVAGQVKLLGRYKDLRPVAVYGGSSFGDQVRSLREGAAIVVGTPGRVVDHLDRGTLSLADVETLILDEADEMISMGFKDDMEKILAAAPRESSNTWLFSATMSKDVRRVADTYLRTPKEVRTNRTEVVPSTVEQFYYPTQESDKPEIICKLIDAAEDFYGLVFCQTKSLVADLTQYLNDKGYKADCLHGDKDQTSRERTMQAFRDRKVRLLVCTDVASRGLDVKDITHVINFSLPRELDNYVHRIGRTARSGKTGIVMNLVTYSHRRLIGDIERLTKTRMLEGKIPTRKEVAGKKVSKLLPAFADQPFADRALEVLGDDWKKALEGLTAEQVAARFLTMQMPNLFNDREADQRAPRISRDKEPVMRDSRNHDRGDGERYRPRDERPAYRADRGERHERPERSGPPRRFAADRGERTERPAYRADRGERADHGDRTERPYRAARADRPAGGFDRPPRRFGAGGDRPERRFDRGDRPAPARGFFGGARAPRPDSDSRF